MANKMKGTVAQFGTKGYGFITGDDGEKYFVHQKNIYNRSRLRADTRVVFSTENSDKGLVAVNVKLEKQKTEPTALTDASIKAMFLLLFIMQAVVLYKVFFLSAT